MHFLLSLYHLIDFFSLCCIWHFVQGCIKEQQFRMMNYGLKERLGYFGITIQCLLQGQKNSRMSFPIICVVEEGEEGEGGESKPEGWEGRKGRKEVRKWRNDRTKEIQFYLFGAWETSPLSEFSLQCFPGYILKPMSNFSCPCKSSPLNLLGDTHRSISHPAVGRVAEGCPSLP